MLSLGIDDLDGFLREDWSVKDTRQAAQQAVQLVGICELLIQQMPGDMALQLQMDVIASAQLFFDKFTPSRYASRDCCVLVC